MSSITNPEGTQLGAMAWYWYKMLCSRTRKGHYPWKEFHRIKVRFPLQRPRLSLPYKRLQSLAVL